MTCSSWSLSEKESFRYEQIMHSVKRQLGEESKDMRWIGGEDVGALAFCR